MPRGYRIAAGRSSAVTRRAVSLLDEDIDALEEAWEKAGLRGAADRTVKVQAPGPITLAAQLELSNGHRAITDAGAVRDLARSLAEGVAAHRAEVARRLECPVVVQFDEPSLPAALAGRLTGVTSLSPVHPVDEAVAAALLDDCVEVVGGDGRAALLRERTAVEAAAAQRLQRAVVRPVDSDGGLSRRCRRIRRIGPHGDAGVVPVTAPQRRPSAEEVARSVVELTDRLGFPRDVLRDRIGVTPACGLAGATAQWARTAMELTQKAADAIADDPAAILK